MDKDNCLDREGKSHFGEFGWYDGYRSSIGNCRLSLKARGSACSDADECSQACMGKLVNGNIISANIFNMTMGERQAKKEALEDKQLEVARREAEKKKMEEQKAKDAEEAKKTEEQKKAEADKKAEEEKKAKEAVKPEEKKEDVKVADKDTPKLEEKPSDAGSPEQKETPKA